MDSIWLKLIGVMIFANIIKYAVMSPLFWVIVDIAALAVCYFLLRTNHYINVRTSMLYLSGFTLISILVDLGIIGAVVGNILSLFVIVWLLWRSHSPRLKKPSLRHKWHK